MDEGPKYFDDDGTEVNPNLLPKPQLCIGCIKDIDPNEELLCNLTRLGQRNEEEFKCYAYEGINNHNN